MSQPSPITFLLNEELITVDGSPALVALDYLRKRRHLCGTKEGCKEGDCGACTVLVGELHDDCVRYQPMTSCLLPLGELHRKHLVSIEGLNMEQLSPVQSAMVECGGTQCGYCTPGFVVAMTGGLMDEGRPFDQSAHAFSTSGNLCRCTGYNSIKTAGKKVFERLGQTLQSESRIEALCKANALPAHFLTAAEQLKKIPEQEQTPSYDPTETIVGGGTDLYVQRGEELPDATPRLLNRSSVPAAEETQGVICVDARMSFEAFARDPLIRSVIPKISEYADLMASWPVRTRATLAGNICNASPIADMTCLLLALETELTLVGEQGERSIALGKFYRGYKLLEKHPSEIVTQLRFPKPSPSQFVHWEKVSKRKILDIATVNSAAKIEIENGTIKQAVLALGGVAAIPLVLEKTAAKLQGLPLNESNVLEALDFAQSEFSPISDVRGSATYKRLLARQLLSAHFTTLFPETFNEEALCAPLR